MVANLTVRSLEYTSDLQSHIEIVCHLLLEKKPKPPATVCGKPSRWCGQSVQILLNYVGCEARKLPAGGEVFFLDFSFYRANRTLGSGPISLDCITVSAPSTRVDCGCLTTRGSGGRSRHCYAIKSSPGTSLLISRVTRTKVQCQYFTC